MKGYRGYYSLIQYCPDASRLEAANIGVVLFCPERGFLEARVSQGNDRIRRFFGSESFDPERLNATKRALVNRLEIEHKRFRTPDDLAQFIETRGNDILLTVPRPLKVFNPSAELDELFAELVGGRQAKEQRSRSKLMRQLRDIFDKPTLKDKIERNKEVVVPVTGAILKAPYAFQNGRLNLICPLTINSRTMTHAKELALEGDLLNKHEKQMTHPAALWIALAKPTDSQGERERAAAEALFQDYKLPVYREEQLEELEKKVEAEAH